MKIIGKTASGFIVEVAHDEVAKIMGWPYFSSMNAANKVDVGSNVNVSAMYDALVFERSRTAELNVTAKKLRTEADRIDKINAALHCALTTENKPS